ncbi:putative transmembrane protein [Methylobacterium sp. 4-46]|uniref:hypothetical protein n=1 Tax=unclassified Methylobacterium TaxID=2615210 RepID=UPI000152E896|nr:MULTISPECIES: hypothetical protein [Methylobacterium]ACA18474.1 putative transmembrane protein [Methylobacterium sp. 4-46]WFT77763.1 hypothetical protein QA634_20910 [Methylobacterium nodulans]
MDQSIPAPAARLLDFIASKEAPEGYGTIYGNNQRKLPTPLVQMTIADVIASGTAWTNRFGSSAAGRYQFMKATLQGLVRELGLSGKEQFSPDLQDQLGFHLLKRRGYEKWAAGKLTDVAFGLALAQEWASFPVLAPTTGFKRDVARGQSFYAGDGLNKALISAEAVEAALVAARAAPKPGATDARVTPNLCPACGKALAG